MASFRHAAQAYLCISVSILLVLGLVAGGPFTADPALNLRTVARSPAVVAATFAPLAIENGVDASERSQRRPALRGGGAAVAVTREDFALVQSTILALAFVDDFEAHLFRVGVCYWTALLHWTAIQRRRPEGAVRAQERSLIRELDLFVL